MLDDAGFPEAVVVASNDLDEHVIESLQQQGAAIAVWGVGTKLVTAYDQPALGGVYKLAALRDADGRWQPKLKLSEQVLKISNPGRLQVRRYLRGERPVADVIFDLDRGVPDAATSVDIDDPTRVRQVPEHDGYRDLLVPVFRDGALVYRRPPLALTREHARAALAALDPRTRRLLNPQVYQVGLEPQLHALKQTLVARARRGHGLA